MNPLLWDPLEIIVFCYLGGRIRKWLVAVNYSPLTSHHRGLSSQNLDFPAATSAFPLSIYPQSDENTGGWRRGNHGMVRTKQQSKQRTTGNFAFQFSSNSDYRLSEDMLRRVGKQEALEMMALVVASTLAFGRTQ